jgi:hypothetical protein
VTTNKKQGICGLAAIRRQFAPSIALSVSLHEPLSLHSARTCACGRAQGKSLLQINGMTPVSHVNRVAVWRPMLVHDKEVVFDFAHTYGVPYFKDTTPTWSNRGKLRNQLMPLLGVRQPSLPHSQARERAV